MVRIVCSVRDSASLLFGQPVFVAAKGQAIRSFQDEVNKGEGDLSRHPEDFELWQLCEWDDVLGKFDGVPALLLRAKDCVVSKE